MKTKRQLLAALGSAFLAPRLAFAQQKSASVVVLSAGESEDDEPATAAFYAEMCRRGWSEGVNIAYTQISIVIALLFVTLPFMVRSVQPVLLELDREMEEAAASLGASPATSIRRIVLPNLAPAILTGGALGFARCMGEFGSVVLISGNIPFQTEVSAVRIYSQVENDNVTAAAAIAVTLLTISLGVLLLIALGERWSRKHDR